MVGTVSIGMTDAQAYAVLFAAAPDLYTLLANSCGDLGDIIRHGGLEQSSLEQANAVFDSFVAFRRKIDRQVAALGTRVS